MNYKFGNAISFISENNYLLCLYTGCPNKKESGTNMPVSLKLDKHLNSCGYYLLEGYLLFTTVPRNVDSITSVNEQEHFNKRLTK